MKKILLNSLPPADINSPSAALSILKSFMNANGFETEVKYWNFILSLLSNYTKIEDTEIKILPFISILNDISNNTIGNNRILSLLQEIRPSHKAYNKDYYAEYLQNTKSKIFEIINSEIKKIYFSSILLFGISSKFHQWIPGMILCKEIKKISPDTKIVVGGFGNKDAAYEALKTCNDFDFAIWGEGEYPLLELAKQLKEETNQYSNTARLLYRENNQIKHSLTAKSEYLNFQNYPLPNHEDYFKTYPYQEKKYQIRVPINSIRACYWNKCKFCDYNHGYKYRERSPESIVQEIEQIAEKYQITAFSFVDNDIFGSPERFEKLLDLLIETRNRNQQEYNIWAEMIPNAMLNAKLLEKMAVAGFKYIFIGYDAISDSLLKKMNKSSNFSDNLFFVKFSLKYGITPTVNVIKGIYSEAEEDVLESIENLHYLRFYFNDKNISFSHRYVTLVISSMTKYYSLMSEEEKTKYNFNVITYLLPDYFSNHSDRFRLFRWKKSVLDNNPEWEKLLQIENFYKTNKYTYKILNNNDIYYFTEYCNNEEIKTIVFDEPEYITTLKIANNKVCTFDELFLKIKQIHPKINAERLTSILTELKASYLIYCNTEMSNIISIIEIE